jgi:hypothetical protein
MSRLDLTKLCFHVAVSSFSLMIKRRKWHWQPSGVGIREKKEKGTTKL